MITIQTTGGLLDVGSEQDISLDWTAFRFSEGLRNPYTTDIELPMTKNNMRILGCYNLLDSPNQLFGNHIQPAILTVNGRMVECYMQLVSVSDTKINVCLYEKTFPMEIREKNIARMFTDDYTTIFAWNVNTIAAYPNWFKEYDYGMPYSAAYAQRHPIKRLDDFLPTIASNCSMTIPPINQDWYVMATGKYICPQNTIQYAEGRMKDDGSFTIMGGQHTTNDLEYSATYTDNDKITFNRDCNVSMDLWVSWEARNNGYNLPFVVNHWHSETSTNTTTEIYMDGATYTNNVETATITLNIKKDDHISFGVVSGDRFKMVSSLAHLEITDYEITDDDYGQEMEYVYRVPRIVVYNYAGGNYIYWNFDATEYTLNYHKRNTGNTLHKLVQTTFASFAWFGYYANIADISVTDFLWGIAWLVGKKPFFSNGEFGYVDSDKSKEIDGIITEKRLSTTRLGMKNYIRWENEENPTPVSEINNVWLENTKDLHKSPFGKVFNLSAFNGMLKQYSNPEHDSESEKYTCDFEDAGFVIMENVTHMGNITVISPYIRDIPLKTFGLQKLTSVVEVTIDTFDDNISDTDYIYLDGRKYMIISGDTDIKTKKTTITALLVPTE